MEKPTTRERIGAGFDRIQILLFLAFIAAPLLVMAVRDQHVPDTIEGERRERVPFPPVSLQGDALGEFPDRFEAFLEDRFGLRDRLIRWYSRLNWYVLGMSPSPKVVAGAGRWLFFDGDPETDDASPVEDYRGTAPLGPHDLERMRWIFQDQHDWLARHGIQYLLVLAPSKTAIYPEHLPDRFTRTGNPRWREQTVAYLRAHTDVPVLDLTPALLEAKSRERVFFYTDTHWSESGGFVGHREIVNALKRWFPRLDPVPESAYEKTTSEAKGGDLARMMHLDDLLTEEHVRLVPRFTPRGNNRAHSDHPRAGVTGGTGDPDLPTAYVYRDSFSDRMLPFLSECFGAIEYEWGQWGSKMKGIEDRQPDVVLQIIGDRLLKAPFAHPPRMQRYAAEQRFLNAGRTLMRLAPDTGFDALTPAYGSRLRPHREGVLVDAPPGGARLLLPAVEDIDRVLPILRLDVRAPKYCVLRVYGRHGQNSAWRRAEEIGLGRAPLEQGRNIVYLPLVDPRPTGPLVIELGAPGRFGFHSIELRAIPRQGPTRG